MADQTNAIDANSSRSLTATSSADGVSIVRLYADPTTHRLLVQTVASSGSGAPATTPSAIGQVYIDTAGSKVYISTNTTNSGGWALLN